MGLPQFLWTILSRNKRAHFYKEEQLCLPAFAGHTQQEALMHMSNPENVSSPRVWPTHRHLGPISPNPSGQTFSPELVAWGCIWKQWRGKGTFRSLFSSSLGRPIERQTQVSSSQICLQYKYLPLIRWILPILTVSSKRSSKPRDPREIRFCTSQWCGSCHLSLSAGFAGAEWTCHQLPVASISCKKPWRNGFVKGHRQSRFGSGFTAKAGNV